MLAQTTTFTYQGRLTDGGTPATGNYDLQFALFDSASSLSGQIGSTQTVPSVPVSSGVFTVTLDFGAGAFSGENRFLEISARLSGGGSFTLLAPRQQITATPYAVRSLLTNAADALTGACVGCVQDANINGVAGRYGHSVDRCRRAAPAMFRTPTRPRPAVISTSAATARPAERSPGIS